MRIVRLHLRNFRRHAGTTLEFPDGVVAVVGPNGSGKSSLLEAVAFALFGPKAAGTGKELIRSEDAPPGDAVRVELEMELGGQAVRIVRELRGKLQSPFASLEVAGHLLVQPTAGSSEQATQQVERLLGLDREGFFHTVVARQRDLDRLGRLAPGERRKFVLDLVGIGDVDEALRQAREARNAVKVQVEEAARSLGDEVELAKAVDEAHVMQTSAHQRLEQEGAAVQHADAGAKAAETVLAQAQAGHAERQSLEATTSAVMQRDLVGRAAADRARAETTAAEERAARLPLLQQEAETLAEAPIRLATAQGLVLVRARRTAQQRRVQHQQTELAQARAQVEAIEVPAAVEMAPLVLALESAQGALARAERTRAVAAERVAQAQSAARRLDGLQGAAPCPTCRQPVTGDHLEAERRAAAEAIRLAAEQAAQDAAAEREARTAAEAARRGLAAAQERAHQADLLARQRQAAEQKASGLAATLAALSETLPPDPGPEEDLSDLQRRAAAAQAAQATLAVTQADAARLGLLRAALLAAEQEAQSTAAELADLRLRLGSLADTRAGLAAATQSHGLAQAALRAAQVRHTAALLERQATEQRLQAALAEQERDRTARARVDGLRRDLARWTAVAGAAGGGLLERFKEHLVARAAPAINQEASQLLALFTQGRYTELVLDDQYEVYMGDGGRLLPLERFSGGEQDLAHLALRLGISRLLATRSGASEIRFLALDEVFSSLDAERCDALLGALRRLTGLYGQVLAVTHLERLQESFDSVVRVQLVQGQASVSVHNG